MAPREIVQEMKGVRPVERVIFHRKPPKGTKSKPFVCDVCKARFSKKYYLQMHKMIHTGERPHKCDICGKGFRMRWRVALHRRIHTGEKPFACSVCDFRANRKDNIRSHMKRRHGDVLYASETHERRSTLPKQRRSQRRKGRRTRQKTKQTICHEMHQMAFEQDLYNRQNAISFPNAYFMPPYFLQEHSRTIPEAFPFMNPLHNILPNPMAKPLPLLVPIGQTPTIAHPNLELLDGKKSSKNVTTRTSHRGMIQSGPTLKIWSEQIVTKVESPVDLVIKEEPIESINCDRPKREAASLSCIRRLSMMLDEEDIKKEIGEEPIKRGSRKGRRLVNSKESYSPSLVYEEVIIQDPPEVWVTEEDLIFTEGDTLKLEEDMELLDKDMDLE